MATLVLRTVKGSPLTNAEVDGNFSNINSEVGVVANLDTTSKANLVAAVNEVKSGVAETAAAQAIIYSIALG